ncbi:MAG: methylenetetrahydrofolate reductase [NAD(P)H] [Planctomycetes bacterium]|nr:methylenetetrahydrofolate reductase [NAD(P)H] [Planctomycetota bacterium]
MRFSEIFRRATEPVVSIEVYPPRTAKARDSLESVLPHLAALRPRFMTVTYGAMGSTREQSVEIASLVRNEHGMETASHLTCVGATREEIDAVLDAVRDAGIENIVALRGDPPEGEKAFEPAEGGYSHADELVVHLRESGEFGIAVAGYPEKHIEAPDMETDLRHLRRKVEAGADIIITQLFYDNALFFEYERRVRELGVRVPVIPGLLPIQSLGQVEKISAMCGATLPPALRRRLEAAGDDRAAVRDIGVEWTAAQARELLDRGAAGIHFYVLNRAEQIERILQRLRSDGTR